jgi:hypothetical protein
MGRQPEFSSVLCEGEIMKELFASLAAPLIDHRYLYVAMEGDDVIVREAGTNNRFQISIDVVRVNGGVGETVDKIIQHDWFQRAFVKGLNNG